ncbi:piggyBac transposable element-derived protein 3-like isoform X7 [Corythoichthys intestinalis]|uniref:piggyBac transposable element-derived protein 3-like isoform X7 n=1 Tax=Corythoichthys intestinalis TaxID=161448 RepID=UPI0025A513FD|nr:piggyBac transposable element-derived protein 3-like isoform X7 [Corythoichthys intestinalis]
MEYIKQEEESETPNINEEQEDEIPRFPMTVDVKSEESEVPSKESGAVKPSNDGSFQHLSTKEEGRSQPYDVTVEDLHPEKHDPPHVKQEESNMAYIKQEAEPESPSIKEEKQEEEIMFPMPVAVKSEDDDEGHSKGNGAAKPSKDSSFQHLRTKEKQKNAATFYAKLAHRTKALPVESDESALSESEGSDDEYKPNKPGEGDESSSNESTVDISSSEEDADGSPHPPPTTNAGPAKATSKRKRKILWRTVKQQNSAKEVDVWLGGLPDANSTRLPIQYFRDFFDDELLDKIVEQSNLYCTQQNPNHALKLDRSELEQFLGCVLFMSIFDLPRSRMYWSRITRLPLVADVMPRDRWEEIKRFIHFCDNMAPKKNDKLYKIRLLIDTLLPKFQALPQDQMLCVDEQMVPFKGRSRLKQYVPKKPYKWGYKMFVLCDTRGLVHSFDIFTGKIDPVPGQPDIGANGNIVLKLAQVIHENVNHLLFFDDWFSSVDLFVALAKKGIPALGTVQHDRLRGCCFSADSQMMKKGRGTFEEQEALVDNVCIRAVKWFDNTGVIVASTFASALPVSNIQRWDRKLKREVSVECPRIISLYNKFMGGVDALDGLIAYYRIHIKSRKYYHRLFFHFVDMVIVNSWLLYRRDADSLDIPRKKQIDLLSFRASIAHALCEQGKESPNRKRGRSSIDVDKDFEVKKRRGPAAPIPAKEIRTDAVGHWPVLENTRQRCKLPKCTGQSVFRCEKCLVHLCLKRNKNCFSEFHSQ